MAAAMVAALPLAAAACTSTGSGGSGGVGVSTASNFEFPSGTPTFQDLQQGLDLSQTAPSTTWSETADITNGTSDVATSDIAIETGATANADGSLPANLVWTVTGSGTSGSLSSLIPNPVSGEPGPSCTSSSASTVCTEPLTIPAASAGAPVDATVSLDLAAAADVSETGTNLWGAVLQIGSTQWVDGIIGVPGSATTLVDTAQPVVNATIYTGSATTCSTIPTTTVQWLQPTDTSSGNTAVYVSSTDNDSCAATFTPNGTTELTVTAPSTSSSSS